MSERVKPEVGLRFYDPVNPEQRWTVVQYDGFGAIYIQREQDGRLFHHSEDSWDRAWRNGFLVKGETRV